MPAKSKSQQRLFGMVDAYKKGELKNPSKEIKDIADGISLKDTKKFAKTKHKGLPETVKKKRKKSVKEAKSFKNNNNYTHFAVNKKTNLIVNGWDYRGVDNEQLRQFSRDYFTADLIDYELNPKDYKILTYNGCIKQGINPDENCQWSNDGITPCCEKNSQMESKIRRAVDETVRRMLKEEFEQGPFSEVDSSITNEVVSIESQIQYLNDRMESLSRLKEGLPEADASIKKMLGAEGPFNAGMDMYIYKLPRPLVYDSENDTYGGFENIEDSVLDCFPKDIHKMVGVYALIDPDDNNEISQIKIYFNLDEE